MRGVYLIEWESMIALRLFSVALNVCGSFILRIGDILCFAGSAIGRLVSFWNYFLRFSTSRLQHVRNTTYSCSFLLHDRNTGKTTFCGIFFFREHLNSADPEN